MPQTQAQIDGYVECSECGHTIEYDHTLKGCNLDGCGCQNGWMIEEIKDLREREGLPRFWSVFA